MKNLQFFKNLQENFAIFFKNSLKCYRILAKIWKIFRKFRNMHLYEVRGAEPPEASEIMEIWVEKSMKTSKFLIVIMEFLPVLQIF